MITEVHGFHRRRTIAATLVLLALTGLTHSEAVDGAQAQPDEIEQMMERFLSAFGNRDVAAFSAYFADDATMFFPPSAFDPPSGRVRGRERIAKGFEALYARTGPPRNPAGRIVPQDLLIQRFGDAAVVTFHLGSDSLRGRRSFVLRRTGSEWRILHLHASTIGPTSR